MDDLDALTDQEKEEKIIAVRALLSTKVPRAVIKEGRARASDRLKRKEKTKYDYMKEKKRDFRIMKHKDKQIEETYDLIESTGKVSYAAFGAAIDVATGMVDQRKPSGKTTCTDYTWVRK